MTAALATIDQQPETQRELVPAQEPAAPAPFARQDNMMGMIREIMMNKDLTPERVNQAFEFYQKIEAMNAKRAFDAALAAAQAEFPPINKNRRVHFEAKNGGSVTDYMHEDLAELVEKCVPVLARHGISTRWRTENPLNAPIQVTCILTHKAGHSEENTLRGAADNSGNKNSLQAIASAANYLERYTFKALVGVASRHDDDGRAGGAKAAEAVELCSDHQLETIKAKLEETKSDEAVFCRHMGVERLADLPAASYARALTALGKRGGDVKSGAAKPADATPAALCTEDQLIALRDVLQARGLADEDFCAQTGLSKLSALHPSKYAEAMKFALQMKAKG
jgi:hypothetical protein